MRGRREFAIRVDESPPRPWLVLMAICALAILIAKSQSTNRDHVSTDAITIGGLERSYRMVLPSGGKPSGLVIALHGVGDSPDSMASHSRLDDWSDEYGLAVVYPAARNGMWQTMGPDAIEQSGNGDARYLAELIRRLQNEFAVLPKDTYLVGMSNGGEMGYLFVQWHSELIGGLLVHSAARPSSLGLSSQPQTSLADSVPILRVAGGADPVSRRLREDARHSTNPADSLIIVPGLGHSWATGHNHRMWVALRDASTRGVSMKSARDP